MRKLPIVIVGTVTIDASGSVDCSGWTFGVAEMVGIDGEVGVDVAGTTLGGWDRGELEMIAHGFPCDCPLGQANAMRG